MPCLGSEKTPPASKSTLNTSVPSGSAGGHLTALLAVSGPEVGLDPVEDSDYSCRIQAAVPLYPHCAATWEGGVPSTPHTALPMFSKSLAEDSARWDSACPA